MNKAYTFFYHILWLIFAVIHPWKVVGNARLPEGGALLCGNHTSMSDPIYVAMALGNKQQCRAMAKAELLRIPILGVLLKCAGVIFVDRGKADIQAIKEAMKALKNQEKLLIFPEGTRVKEGSESKAHTGAAMLATKTGVPIIPIYIPRKKRHFKKTTIVFGKPYFPVYEGQKPTPEDYERITEELMERIFALEAQSV